jgi:hypothetical protein
MAEVKTEKALDALVTALERRTNGMTGRQFENMVSPAMGAAFVQGWIALDRNPDDIPGEWQDMADIFNEL